MKSRKSCRRVGRASLLPSALLFLACLGYGEPVLAQSQQPVYRSASYSVYATGVEQGAYSAHVISPTEIASNYPSREHGAGEEARWKLDEDISRFPQLQSSIPLSDAIYNMALGELQKNLRPDGAFNAGAKWQGVWTRDVSYSTLLSLAIIEPQAAKESLLHKIKRDRIVQDTGTGGSWPVSSDRVTWALAAWEIYLVTGDRKWLAQSYSVIENSIKDDEAVVLDPATGLARGESSFMDWREQTYPRWMQPADIYESKNLGTNAVYYRTYRILALMAAELHQPNKRWNAQADRIRSAMNQYFWQKDHGYYAQYLYGRVWQSASPRSDALGEALCILFDIAEPGQQEQILHSQPLMPFGIPTIYPEIPNIPPYHNRSVWPFVQAFWNLAAAKQGDQEALLYGIASLYRVSALFLTNKENFVVDSGSPIGTEINSDRQLWSVAGSLAMVYRVFFGMRFETDGLHLNPCIPEAFGGSRRLTNFHYRGATFSLEVRGFGSQVRSVTVDGHPGSSVISPSLTGDHSIVVQMSDHQPQRGSLHMVESETSPETPEPRLVSNSLTWSPVADAAHYKIFRNGEVESESSTTSFPVKAGANLAIYQVAAVSPVGVSSFLSQPLEFGPAPLVIPVHAGKPDAPFVRIDQAGATGLSVDGQVPNTGRYVVAFEYANGSGPVNTDNKCAIRTLFIDGSEIGPIVMPQRGSNLWSEWGISSRQITQLAAGNHQFELRLLPQDLNMSGEVNTALVKTILLTPVD